MRGDRGALLPSMRLLLRVAALLVFLAGLQLFVFPLRTEDWFAWTIAPPMTAVFLGASYWSSAVLELAGAAAGTWHRARLSVWTVLVFTVLTLVVTLVHLDRFHLGAENPASARGVTWGWIAVYALVPVAMVLVGWVQTGRARGAPRLRRRPLPVPLRGLLAVLGVVLLATGVALLLAPEQAAGIWPWELTPLTGRAVGAWCVGLGWAAAHAVLLDDLDAVAALGPTGVAFLLLQGLALLRFGDVLDWSDPRSTGYVVVLLAIGVAGGWITLLRPAGLRAAGGAGRARAR